MDDEHQIGQGLIEYILLLGLVAVVVLGGLALLGGGVESSIRRVGQVIGIEPASTPSPTPQSYTVTVRAIDEAGLGLAGLTVFAYDGVMGHYLRPIGSTDRNGTLQWTDASPGSYAFRADYQSQMFWSEEITVPGQTHATIRITRRVITVLAVTTAGQPVPKVPVYAYAGSQDVYTGVMDLTDANGEARLLLVDGTYIFRGDYQGHSYWSDKITSPAQTSALIKIDLCDLVTLGDVAFLGPGGGVDGGRIRLTVISAGIPITVTKATVYWDYMEKLESIRPSGDMRLFGIFVCPGALECNAWNPASGFPNRFLHPATHFKSEIINPRSSPSSGEGQPQVMASNGGSLHFDFDTLWRPDPRKLTDIHPSLQTSDFGFTIYFAGCPAGVTRPAVPR